MGYVPVFAGSDKGKSDSIIRDKKASVDISSIAKDASWVKLNFGQHVPIRVLYPPAMIERLAANVQSLSAEDRIGLLSDAEAFCKAGLQDPEQLVQLLSGFQGERNDKVWSQLQTTLGTIDEMMRGCFEGKVIECYERFAEGFILPAFLQVGWDTRPADDDNTKKLRTSLASLIGKFSSADKDHMKSAAEKGEAFLQKAAEGQDTTGVLAADIRAAVLISCMKANSSAEFYDRLVTAHNKTDDGTVRQAVYAALSKSKSKELRDRSLAWALTEEVRPQDLIYLPMFVTMSGREGAEDCWQWMQTNFDSIYRLLGNTSMILFQHMVAISGRGFVTEEKAAEVQQFWESKKELIDKVTKKLQQTVEGIKANAKFAARVKVSKLADPDFWGKLSEEKANR